jgi:phage-related protein
MQINTITSDIDNFILKLDPKTKARVFRCVELLEKYEYKLGMPYSRSLHDGLFELRIMGEKHVRILYCFNKNTIYLLNIFIKKTNKVSNREIDLAIKRRKILA